MSSRALGLTIGLLGTLTLLCGAIQLWIGYLNWRDRRRERAAATCGQVALRGSEAIRQVVEARRAGIRHESYPCPVCSRVHAGPVYHVREKAVSA